MSRVLFEKIGNARFISHLDLMRVFQRAFKRAGLSLTHTQGFNPRPSVSIALPLSLGVESHCELLDFALEQNVNPEEVRTRLNAALVEGVKVLAVYEQGDKIKNLTFLRSRLTLEYDAGISDEAIAQMEQLFSLPELVVEKWGKNGVCQQDILPMIRSMSVKRISDREVEMEVLHCCQNPSLNPMQIGAAVTKYLPDLTPGYIRCCREEIYNHEERIFR